MNLVQQNDPIQSNDSHHILYSTVAAHTIMDFLLLTPGMWAARISVSTACKRLLSVLSCFSLENSFQMAVVHVINSSFVQLITYCLWLNRAEMCWLYPCLSVSFNYCFLFVEAVCPDLVYVVIKGTVHPKMNNNNLICTHVIPNLWKLISTINKINK